MDWSKLLEPRGNMVLVKRIPRTASAGGILMPDTVANDMMAIDTAVYQVLRCGPGAYNTVLGTRMDMNLKPGDLVLATAQAGAGTREVTQDSNIAMLSETDILGVIHLPLSHFRIEVTKAGGATEVHTPSNTPKGPRKIEVVQ